MPVDWGNPDWGKAGLGAVTGAAGAAAGGPITALLGALGGGLAGAYGGSKVAGSEAKNEQLSKLTTPQQGLKNQVINRAMGGLKGLDFAPIANEARNNFTQNLAPSLAERYTAMGGRGYNSITSPNYQNYIQGAGANLEAQLAGLGSQYGLEKEQLLQHLEDLGLHGEFDTLLHPSQPGLLGSAASSLGKEDYQGLLKALVGLLGMQGQQQSSGYNNNMTGGNSIGFNEEAPLSNLGLHTNFGV